MEKKVYTEKKEKVIDFLIGFLLIPLAMIVPTVSAASAALFGYFPLALFLIEVGVVVYLSNKRKFIGTGFLFFLAFGPLVLVGTCVLNNFLDGFF